MKRHLFIILILLAFVSSCSNTKEDVNIDTEEKGLIGNVKSVITKTFRDSTTIEHTKEYYDTNGFMQVIEYFRNDSVAKTDSIKRDSDFRVDFKKTDLPNGTSQTQTYIYGSNGLKKIVQKLNGTQNTVWVYDNDEDGRKVKETVIIDDDVKRVVRYQYVNDSITRAAIYNQAGEKENMIEYNITDSKAETTFQTYFSKDHTSASKIIISLDSLGNPVKETHFKEGKETDIFTYWYDYDEKENWIIKFSYSNDELVGTTERKIEYYK